MTAMNGDWTKVPRDQKKSKANKKLISIRLSEALLKKSRETAQADGVTLTSLIERALTAELNKR